MAGRPLKRAFARAPPPMTFLNISTHALFGQLLLGLINGAFYAVL